MTVPPLAIADPSGLIPRIQQVQWDHYYMQVALTVRSRANCTGQHVAAVLVLNNRIVSTGFNATPPGFAECEDGGCEICRQRELPVEQRTDPIFEIEGTHLDICICGHAEANALLAAAREGIATDGTTLYVTHKPCFMCLQDAVQAGVRRIVYLRDYELGQSMGLKQQYELLVKQLRADDAQNFERLASQRALINETGLRVREPNLDHLLGEAEPGIAPPPLRLLPHRRWGWIRLGSRGSRNRPSSGQPTGTGSRL